jgi:hypothetical protein
MNRIQLKKLLKLAVEKMIQDDESRKPRRPLLRSAERNISASLRGYLEQSLVLHARYECYQVDHEYNRMGDREDPKYSPNIDLEYFVPDIIVHRRGVEAKVAPDANLLAVEVKRIDTFAGSLGEIANKKDRYAIANDLRKLKVLREGNDEFRYKHTASVIFSTDRVWVALDGSEFEKLLRFPANLASKHQK